MVNRVSSRIAGRINISALLAFVFGVVFLTTMLVFAVAFPNPTGFQLKVFGATLSLAAGGVGAVLPGMLNFQFGGMVKAGGALALAAIVWFTQPVIAPSIVDLQEPKTPVESTLGGFLAELDAGDVAGTFDLLDDEAKKTYGLDMKGWQDLYDANVSSLGKLEWRKKSGVGGVTNYPGLPLGLYRHVVYISKYANDSECRSEIVAARATQDLTWRVFSYQISPMTFDCGNPPPPSSEPPVPTP
jgi:hypothetical protein